MDRKIPFRTRNLLSMESEEYPIPGIPDQVKAMVFDLDGTVLHTMHHHWQAWEQVSTEYNFELTKETLLSMAGTPSEHIMEQLAREQKITIDTKAAALRKQKIYVSLAHETEVIPMVVETARLAKKRGLPIAVATGGTRLQVEKAMKAAMVDDLFDAIVTADEVTHGKPHPETFLKAAELLGVPPQYCVGFEDAPRGLEAIQNAEFLKGIDVTKLPGYPSI